MVMKYWRKSSKKMDSTYNIQGLLWVKSCAINL
jgi:hypothetical protein